MVSVTQAWGATPDAARSSSPPCARPTRPFLLPQPWSFHVSVILADLRGLSKVRGQPQGCQADPLDESETSASSVTSSDAEPAHAFFVQHLCLSTPLPLATSCVWT